MARRFDITWALRSLTPATEPANADFPYGIAVDLTAGNLPACVAKLPYPAEGVGTHVIECRRCGIRVAVTAAGRADDPTQVTIPCFAKG